MATKKKGAISFVLRETFFLPSGPVITTQRYFKSIAHLFNFIDSAPTEREGEKKALLLTSKFEGTVEGIPVKVEILLE